eukprot:TRINITY_DN9276_c0_g1_i1.p1 TRINITY_DN9276_c0_g1~~TRINITY_DN9276_c0_g1_i1.p1  ORF type:complete len:235 (+),score=55.06 TRINITY_DN9276_c0_g1_i1:235-939(+)
MPFWTSDGVERECRDMLTSAPGWIIASANTTAVQQQAKQEASYKDFEAQMADKSSQARRMVHNERFLHSTLRSTAIHNRRQTVGGDGGLGTALRQLGGEAAEPGKLRVAIQQTGSMGLRMQPGSDGRPVVVSLGSHSEAAAQGVVPGMSLRSVQGVSTKGVEYQVIIDWISSLEERPMLLRFDKPKQPPEPGKTKKVGNKKRKREKKEKKEKKKKKKKKRNKSESTSSDGSSSS